MKVITNHRGYKFKGPKVYVQVKSNDEKECSKSLTVTDTTLDEVFFKILGVFKTLSNGGQIYHEKSEFNNSGKENE